MSGLFDLDGRLAVVTGARRGIGRAMAEALAAAGADIIGVSARLRTDDEVAETVRGLGRAFEAHAVDFADRDAVIALGTALAGRAPDILINNAGTIERAPAAQHPLTWWDRVIEVNLERIPAGRLGPQRRHRGRGGLPQFRGVRLRLRHDPPGGRRMAGPMTGTPGGH